MKKELLIAILLTVIPICFADLIVPNQIYSDSSFILIIIILALITTIILEVMSGVVYVYWSKSISKRFQGRKKQFFTSIIIANIITVPTVWYVLFQSIETTNNIFLIMGFLELFAILFEAVLIHQTNKEVISVKHSLILSIVMNISSMILGLPFFIYLLMMIGMIIAPFLTL
jgi:hypothetical protein